MSPLVIASGPGDPRLTDVDDDFRRVLIDLSGLTAYAARQRARFLHPVSTGATGTLRVVPDPAFPAHAFLAAGREFAVVARYSSARGADDRGISPRGLSLRFRSGAGAALFDLTFNTGECFFAPTADTFRRLSAGTDEERDRVLADRPDLRDTVWDTERVATSFAAYALHSQTPRPFVAADGTAWLARFRVVPAAEPVRAGHVDPGGRWWPPTPPETVPPPPGTTGPATVLRDELDARIAGGGVRGLLQVRLRPLGGDPEQGLDATRRWPDGLPWLDVAHLRLDRSLPGDEVDALAFDPALAPPDLGIALTRSPFSTASVSHLRALVYRMSSAARLGEPMPDELAELLRPPRSPAPSAPAGGDRRTVCVVGAGPAGLAAARELERAGHRAVVLEVADHVAGKAASVHVDGHPHDLGAHICTARYRRLAALAAELGVETEPTPAERVLTVGPSGRTVTDMAFFTDGSVERYERLRAAEFPRIGEPGLAHSAAALAAPLSVWLDAHGLRSMYATFGLGYTCAGYGFADDDLPAVYFVKYCETTGLLSDLTPEAVDAAPRWTPAGGFGALWEKVAAGLSDVRTGVTITAIERGAGVVVHTDGGTVEADDLILAVSPERVVDVLDATDDERRRSALVRHQRYRTTVASVSGLPRDAFYLLGAYADTSADRGHCIGFQHRYPDSDVYTCYSYLGPTGAADPMEHDLAEQGGHDVREHLRRDWLLMPHVASPDVGVLGEWEAAQGERHTYLTGGLLGFESVECAIGHAQDLVRRVFGGAAPAPAAAPGDAVRHTAPEIRDWLCAAVAGELRLPSVDPDDALSGFALDSLALAGLMTRLSDHLGFRVPHTLFLQLPTINAVGAYLAGHDRAAAVEQWQAALRSSFAGGATPLFCVGGIGASGTYLRPLAAALAPDVPLYPFEVPGRLDGVGEALDDVAEIAAGFVEQVRALVPDGPYHLAGHSYGGVIAYEMGRRLRAAGAEVGPVTLLDTFVAVAGQPVPPEDEYGALRDQVVIRHMSCLANGRCDCGVDLDAPLGGQRTAVARALGAVDPERYDEHVAALIDVQLGSIHAYATYGFPASDLTVHLLRTEDAFAPMPAEHFGLLLHLDEPANGWEHVDVGALRVFPVSGNHFAMFVEPNVRQVTDAIRAGLPARGGVGRRDPEIRSPGERIS